MKYLSLVFLILTSALSLMASSIEGHVIDKQGEFIAGANCVCFSLPDSTFNNFALSDESGYFILDEPETDWYIVINSLGYNPFHISKSEYLKLRETNLPINIALDSKSSELQEVVVAANKGAMSMNNGIISFNNLNEITKERVISSAHEMLLALPLISSIDGNNISLTGAPIGSVVYINGKQAQMDASTMIDYLKSIPPEMVQGIEIIYTPSPKWKTRSSVINVKLKQKAPFSFNGQVNASGTWKHTLNGHLGSSLFLGLPKLNINTGYYFKTGKSINKEVFLGRHTVGTDVTEVHNIDESKTQANTHNVFALFDYEINKDNSLSINYNGQFSPKLNNNMHSENSVYGRYDSELRSDNWFNAVSISYSNKKGIETGIDYSHYSANRNQEIINNDIPENPALIGHSSQRVNRVKTYIDMNTPLKKGWSLSYGIAYELNRNNNRMTNIADDSNMTSDKVTTETTEHIATAYIGGQKSFLEGRLSVSAFLKGEIYRMDNYKKTQLLPSATITYIPSYSHIFQASYQSFRKYPSLWQRQDYKSYSNPYQLNEGNPTLKPATYNVASLLYLFKQKYTLSLSYYYTSDFFLTQSFQSEDALVLISKPYNIDYSSVFDLSLTIPINIGKVYFSNISVNASLEKFKSSNWHNLVFDKSNLGGGIMIDNTFTLSQKPKISINLTGMYKLPSLAGLWERGHAWLLNAGISGAFFNDNLTVSLDGFDLLQSLYPEKRIRLDKQWMNINDNYFSRYLSLNITYKFKGYKNKDIKSYDTSRYGFE
ncbi:MAG: TonB-dependent receptor family protein [Muribaculaceae bacterium]|nr:TonB-dependent receptor family protein [Muribaculaceae bacterium]